MLQSLQNQPAWVVSSLRDKVGESPVWSVSEQALYWVDIEGRCINRLDWVTRAQRTWTLDERVGCIALLESGSPRDLGKAGDSQSASAAAGTACLLAAMETGVFLVQLGAATKASATCIAPIQHPQTNMRFNDGRCDRAGRFWLTTMCMDMSLAAPVGAVFCLDGKGLSGPKVDGLITPNGLGFSPDNKTLYLSDSHPSVQKIWAFDFDLAQASVSNRRLWVDMANLPGRPDGAAVDERGNYWICGNDAGLVHCFSPLGELLTSVPVPVAKPSMCAFGGPCLDTLLVTSIQPQGAPTDSTDLAGVLLALDVGVCGLPEPRFAH